MNNINRLIIFLLFFILGCTTSNEIQENRVIQKIESLNMNIFSEKGDKIYSITSPNSRYDKVQLKFNLKSTTINIFEGEDIKYIIISDSSKISDNNKIVELNGNVELKNQNEDNDILYGDKLIWNVDESEYKLMGNIKFESTKVLLYSDKAILGKDNIIEFFNPVKYIIKDDNNEKKYEINSENAFYNINTESLSFSAKEKRVRSRIYF
jgi:LPS export ABC transporter protein LptC